MSFRKILSHTSTDHQAIDMLLAYEKQTIQAIYELHQQTAAEQQRLRQQTKLILQQIKNQTPPLAQPKLKPTLMRQVIPPTAQPLEQSERSLDLETQAILQEAKQKRAALTQELLPLPPAKTAVHKSRCFATLGRLLGYALATSLLFCLFFRLKKD